MATKSERNHMTHAVLDASNTILPGTIRAFPIYTYFDTLIFLGTLGDVRLRPNQNSNRDRCYGKRKVIKQVVYKCSF